MSSSIRKIALVVVISTSVFGAASSALAADVMPSFATVPTGWVTDRYAPTSFSNIGTYQGRDDVLGIGISAAGNLANRPAAYRSSFYNTQGMQYAVAGGAGDSLEADLFIESSWRDAANGNVRTDMWGVMTDATPPDLTYPIIGFTNYGGSARYRVWDADIGWVDLNTPVAFGTWTSFAITFTGTSLVFSINDISVYTDTTTDASGFSAVIMQAYNFGDPSITNPTPVLSDYVVHWSNAQGVPEPGTLAMLGLGLAGLAASRRRKLG